MAITWTFRTAPNTFWYAGAAQNAAGRIFLGAYVDPNEVLFASDDNGATLVTKAWPTGPWGPYRIRATPGRIVAIAEGGSHSFGVYSTDGGDSWTTGSGTLPQTQHLVFDGSNFVVFASGLYSSRSVDGNAWVNNPTTSDTFYSVVEGGGYLLAATGSKIIRTSDGGGTWTTTYSGAIYGLHAESGQVFACGNAGLLLSSDDGGLTWSAMSSGTSADLRNFASTGGVTLVSGTNGVVRRTVDAGSTWEGAHTWATDQAIKLSASNGVFLAIDGTTSPSYSEDSGTTWTQISAGATLDFFLPTSDGALGIKLGSSGGYWTAEFSNISVEGVANYAIPALMVSGSSSDEQVQGIAEYALPALLCSATGSVDPRYVYALDYAGVSSVAPTSTGLIAALALSSASAVSTAEVDTLVAATAISSALAASVLASQTVAGATAISLVWLDVAHQELVPADVWAMNAETGGFTRYEGFDFNSYAKIGGRYYGCKEDGIHQLDGDTDEGLPIRSMVSFGKQNFGTSALKRITNAYVGVSGQGRLFLKVMAEGQEYIYAARSYDEAIQVQRFETGKGLRVNWLEFELYNADGEDFELASVEFAVVPTSRRI